MDVSKLPEGPWIVPDNETSYIVDSRLRDVAYSNAGKVAQQLIIDAGNVAHETGKSPRELADERARLIATLRNLLNAIDLAYAYQMHRGQLSACRDRAAALLADIDPPKEPALKPCPCCGRPLSIITHGLPDNHTFMAICERECVSFRPGATREDAIANANKRA